MQRLLSASVLLTAGILTVSAAGDADGTDPVLLEQVSLEADDGVATEGMLYSIPSMRPKTVVVTMHPNDDRQRHYMLRPAAARGFAGFGMKSRAVVPAGRLWSDHCSLRRLLVICEGVWLR